jgi:hypothetical protein
MTGQAEFVPLFLEQVFGDDPMAEVAILALSRLHDGVDGFAGKIFLGELFMAVETVLPLELPLLRP